MRKRYEVLHPNGKYRVELVCEDQAWSYECWELEAKGWHRLPSRRAAFDSYAAALVSAQRQMPWIAVTFKNWHVELLRGSSFRLTTFNDSLHSDHNHCSVCRRKFMSPQSGRDGAEHDGYVTRYEMLDGSKRWQWNWVCTQCFGRSGNSTRVADFSGSRTLKTSRGVNHIGYAG
jgi:hypothetical protein